MAKKQKTKIIWSRSRPSKKVVRAARQKRITWSAAKKSTNCQERVDWTGENRFAAPAKTLPMHNSVMMPSNPQHRQKWLVDGFEPGSLFVIADCGGTIREDSRGKEIQYLIPGWSSADVVGQTFMFYTGTVRIIECTKSQSDPISCLKHQFVCAGGKFIIDDLELVRPVV